MNFLKILFSFLFLLLILAAGLFLIGREFWLFSAAQQVRNSAVDVTRVNRWTDFLIGCIPDEESQESVYNGFQLRFINERQYQLEVNCLQRDPVVMEAMQLPAMVVKTSGSAGFFYNLEERSLSGEVTLEFLGRSRTVSVNTEQQVAQRSGATEYWSPNPRSFCSAFGYTCCDAVTQSPVGEGLSSGVVDCPGSCFSSCQQRPVLLSFQSDPRVDAETRATRIQGSSVLVIFSFLFDDSESAIREVTIDFGDGENELVFTAEGRFEKEYRCESAGGCIYTVTIQAEDERGIQSAVTRLSELTIELVP